jgi:hypothetical protein
MVIQLRDKSEAAAILLEIRAIQRAVKTALSIIHGCRADQKGPRGTRERKGKKGGNSSSLSDIGIAGCRSSATTRHFLHHDGATHRQNHQKACSPAPFW